MAPVKCKTEGCKKIPSYGIINTSPVNCSEHKSTDMINLISKRCEQEGCLVVTPAYDIKGGKGRFCVEHKSINMYNVLAKICKNVNCDKRASYDIEGSKGSFCASHKTSEMFDIHNKHCISKDCNVLAYYNFINEKAIYCSTHKLENMIDVKSKHCINKDCTKRPSYGKKGGKQEYCNEHKIEGSILINNKNCKNIGCDKAANYGLKGQKIEYCVNHKTKDMTNSYFKNCIENDCNTRARYSEKGKPVEYCSEHKKDNMTYGNVKICEGKDCKNSNPGFNVPGGKGKFCSLHKTAEMINVLTKMCEEKECNVGASYGKPGTRKTHCFTHRLAGMIRRPNGKCLKCSEPAVWGVNYLPKHCDEHKTEDEQNLLEKPCISCGLMYILDTEGKCEICNPVNWIKMRLIKQNALMNYLDSMGLKGDQTDKIIDGGICGKERPDRIYDFGDKIVILECDENQHQERACQCEQTRMINIGQSFGGIPVYFIRWNPDDYNSKTKPEVLSKRYKLVGDLIKSISDNKVILPKALVSAFYMYYDGWKSYNDEEWYILQ